MRVIGDQQNSLSEQEKQMREMENQAVMSREAYMKAAQALVAAQSQVSAGAAIGIQPGVVMLPPIPAPILDTEVLAPFGSIPIAPPLPPDLLGRDLDIPKAPPGNCYFYSFLLLASMC